MSITGENGARQNNLTAESSEKYRAIPQIGYLSFRRGCRSEDGNTKLFSRYLGKYAQRANDEAIDGEKDENQILMVLYERLTRPLLLQLRIVQR